MEKIGRSPVVCDQLSGGVYSESITEQNMDKGHRVLNPHKPLNNYRIEKNSTSKLGIEPEIS